MSASHVIGIGQDAPDLAGQRFVMLVAVSPVVGPKGRVSWACRCDCGQVVTVRSRDLLRGHTKSCGCGHYRLLGENSRKRAAERRVKQAASRISPDGRVALTRGFVALVDPEDIPLITGRLWSAQQSHNTWYAKTATPRVLMHVLIMGKRDGMQVDHKNGNGLDNRRENLRWAFPGQNVANTGRRRGAKNKYKGVSPPRRHSRKWEARIHRDGKQVSIGWYATVEDAARAYDAAAKELYGEFARLNFPEAGE